MDFTKLKDYLDSLIKDQNVPGVDCIVYKEHELVFRYFKGMRDIENKIEIDGNEQYFIFSMTKMLTCVSALQLYEKGKFSLDDPISKYMPEFETMMVSASDYDTSNAVNIITGKNSGEFVANENYRIAQNPITVKNLFTMGAGLNYDLQAEGIKEALSKGKKSTREIVSALSKTILSFEPGTRFKYSLCHDVLAALIEIWSGKNLGEYMSENIFEPLGMKNTFFGPYKDAKKPSAMSAIYRYDNDHCPQRLPLECPYILSEEYQSGGAGLVSTTEDYAVFLDALANGGIAKNGYKILNSETVELMKKNHLNESQLKDFYQLRKGYGYGLGVRTHINSKESGSLSPIGEFGWDGAAGAFSMVDTDNKLSLTYFQHIYGWDVKMQEQMRNALYECINE